MKFYEVVFIVRQEASASHVESVAQEVTTIIKNNGGDVTKTEFCGLRNLAYPIKKCKKGHYVLINAVANAETVSELERQFRLSEDILRFLIVRVDELNNTPSALMRRNFRDNQQQDKN
ncbi:MAG: 30S ribosomal protein S6 [Alphaproteobacteria bacterium]|nr:30S ribosomal protein S6 [Alphaproteobacteria bacterium]